MLANLRAIPAAVLLLRVFERLKTMALALARWNPEQLTLSGILLRMRKTRDERFYERNPLPASLLVCISISTLLMNSDFVSK
jgi:hypothetical protein